MIKYFLSLTKDLIIKELYIPSQTGIFLTFISRIPLMHIRVFLPGITIETQQIYEVTISELNSKRLPWLTI